MLIAETEGKLSATDKNILGDTFYEAANSHSGRPPKGYKPHPYLKMRGGVGGSFKLKSGNEELGQVSEMRKFREAYIGAIFNFYGRKYRVHSHEANAVVLEGVEHNLKTEPNFYTVPYQASIFNGYAYGDFEIYYGTLNIVTNFSGYKLVEEGTGEVKDSVSGAGALTMNNLHTFWITLPTDEESLLGVGALEHMIRVGAMFVIPADRFDSSTYSRTGDDPTSFYYENYRGGIGVARKLFQVWRKVLQKGAEIAQHCGCKTGCPNCIQPAKSYNISNADINKGHGITLANKLLSASATEPDRIFSNGLMVPYESA